MITGRLVSVGQAPESIIGTAAGLSNALPDRGAETRLVEAYGTPV